MAKRRSPEKEAAAEGAKSKQELIAQLIQLYDIKTGDEIQEALKDLLGGIIRQC